MHWRTTILAVALALTATADAQWKDRKQLGRGGESSIATDGKGNLFATSHQPSQLFVSRDFGASWEKTKDFAAAICDLHVIASPDGKVFVAYMKSGGLTVWSSADSGKTLTEGKSHDGPFDREWLALNPVNNELYMDYSHGYIGGPASEGVFLAASKDNGKSFERRSRVDKEPATSYPVDPYLQTGTDGRIYAMWGVSKDKNTIDSFALSFSADSGKTFQGHTTIGKMHKEWGDTQERWMLGSLTAVGKSTVVAFYPDYAEVVVDGRSYYPLLHYYRVSTDGGKTFSDPKPITPQSEIEAGIRSVAAKSGGDTKQRYIQTLAWSCAGPDGRVHVAWQDNRAGQTDVNGTKLDQWHVRFATSDDLSKGFGPSDQVSDTIAAGRPPLDFLSCTVDSNRAYVIWTEEPNTPPAVWPFSGNLYVARKILPKK
jgi:hypothetical protein